jgi:SAM-dependent methyltransferase
MNAVATDIAPAPLNIDLGAGKNPRQGYIGVDSIDFGNGNIICNIGDDRWPWEDSTVDAAHCSHTIEHLTNFNDKWQRVHFFNELWRCLKPGASCSLIFPHWSSDRYYGDPTHKEVISPFAFYYLDPKWREVNAPHADSRHVPHMYRCDFECTWGATTHPDLNVRSPEYKQFAMQWYKEAWQDVQCNLKARKV